MQEMSLSRSDTSPRQGCSSRVAETPRQKKLRQKWLLRAAALCYTFDHRSGVVQWQHTRLWIWLSWFESRPRSQRDSCNALPFQELKCGGGSVRGAGVVNRRFVRLRPDLGPAGTA